MCWSIHIMDGDKVVRKIKTTGAAIAFFGADNVRYDVRDYDAGALADPRMRRTPQEDVEATGDFCLCPIDTDHLIDVCGYRRIEASDPRWSAINTCVEKRDDKDK